MNLLALDTATAFLVIGARRGGLLWTRTLEPTSSHGELLLDGVEVLLREADLNKTNLHAIVVGSGPGAFTGTRVGWAAALGMAEGLGIPAVSVPTLDALGWQDRESGRTCLAVINAHRGRFYAAVYMKGIRIAGYFDLEAWNTEGLPRRVVGPHALDFAQLAGGEGWQPMETSCWARGLLDLGADKVQQGETVNPGEGPLYLRPGVSK